MRRAVSFFSVIGIAIYLLAGTVEADDGSQILEDPIVSGQLIEFSDAMATKYPEIQQILFAMNVDYLHELDPSKVYRLNKTTNEVSVVDASYMASPDAVETEGIGFGLGSVVTTIEAQGGAILGLGRTVVTCPFGSQTAGVEGFMATQQRRDPPQAVVREGEIVVDNMLTTVAEVNFSLLLLTGGARNPANRTTMNTLHIGLCGDDFQSSTVVSTWPPLRIQFTIDDTGSMSEEIGGLRTALANFIESRDSDTSSMRRGILYELVTFKDAPSLDLELTSDAEAARTAVNSLVASGGADCPEESLGALSLSLDRMTADESSLGEIVLATDASPQNGDIDGLIASAQAIGVPVHVILSGDCVTAAAASDDLLSAEASLVLSAREVFSRIAEETGGVFVFAPGVTADDYAEIFEDIFGTIVTGDSEPPEVMVSVTPDLLWPPNHELIEIVPTVTAVDNVDPDPTIEFVGVAVNEPFDGQGSGNTADDVVIGEDGTIYLRSERSGTGNGRIYRITFKATDQSGNEGFGSAEVIVPHNQ